MAFQSCGKDVEVLTSCPDDAEQLLFIGANTATGMALRSWGKVKNCLIASIFGVGTLTINGTQLDGSGIYLNSGLIENLNVFYNGLNRYLDLGTEWRYETLSGNVVGIQILLGSGFTSADIFLIIPNPIAT